MPITDPVCCDWCRRVIDSRDIPWMIGITKVDGSTPSAGRGYRFCSWICVNEYSVAEIIAEARNEGPLSASDK